jgi:hypothetical protein
MNIKGGTTVTILWLLNSPCKGFEDRLAPDTAAALKAHRAKANDRASIDAEKRNPFDVTTLASFPMVSTFAMDWPPELVSLMQQQASWIVHKAKKELQAMLKAAALPLPATV